VVDVHIWAYCAKWCFYNNLVNGLLLSPATFSIQSAQANRLHERFVRLGVVNHNWEDAKKYLLYGAYHINASWNGVRLASLYNSLICKPSEVVKTLFIVVLGWVSQFWGTKFMFLGLIWNIFFLQISSMFFLLASIWDDWTNPWCSFFPFQFYIFMKNI